MTTSTSKEFYVLSEFPDLMSDACVCDSNGQLACVSLWGRDTSIQEFIARITLGSSERGIGQFHLETATSGALPVFIGHVDMLEKRATRTFHQSLFGSILNLWLYDRRCATPDKVNGNAFAIMRRANDAEIQARLWALVRETCPLPLLEHWRPAVMNVLQASEMLTTLPFCLGPIVAFRLKIDQSELIDSFGALIRNGTLSAFPASETTALPAAA